MLCLLCRDVEEEEDSEDTHILTLIATPILSSILTIMHVGTGNIV